MIDSAIEEFKPGEQFGLKKPPGKPHTAPSFIQLTAVCSFVNGNQKFFYQNNML